MKRLPKNPVAREKEKARRAAVKEREAQRKAKRKAKREAKAAPRKALATWSAQVRSVGRCAVCGSDRYLNSHHLLPKERYPEYRLEPLNGVCLCPTHHKYGRYSFHRNPIWAVLWLRRCRQDQFNWAKAHLGGPMAPSVPLRLAQLGQGSRDAR
jgi:hypothetical protein